MNGNGRVAGIVSDSGFGCTSRQGLIKAEPGHLFPHLSLSLSVADFSTPEQRDSLVMTFAGRNIEYAKNRSDLDRLFSQKAEKIVGCFRRNRLSDPDSRDSSQPCFDELVTAALSRLSVKNSGFVLLIGSKAAEEARKNGQFADMYEHLLMQEKVLHHINSFVSGQKDTLLLLIQEVHPGTFHFNQKFSLKEFSQKATIIPELVKSLIAGEKTVSQFLSAEDFFDQANSAKIEKFIELKDALGLSAYFQKLLVQKYDMSFEPGLSELSQTSLAVFSQGLGAEILGGLVTYKEFIRRLSLITGIQTQE
jgi:alkaline phosphatase